MGFNFFGSEFLLLKTGKKNASQKNKFDIYISSI